MFDCKLLQKYFSAIFARSFIQPSNLSFKKWVNYYQAVFCPRTADFRRLYVSMPRPRTNERTSKISKAKAKKRKTVLEEVFKAKDVLKTKDVLEVLEDYITGSYK